MDAVVDQLEATITADLIQRMGGDTSGEFATMDLSDIVITYLNWRARYIDASPRQVKFSRELLASAKYAEHRTAIDSIAVKVAAGDDVTAHLSKRIESVYVPRAKRRGSRGRRPDIDRLIADWGIHHLHLSTNVEEDTYVTRTGDLLFAHFADDVAYLIGVFPHGVWTLMDIAEITVRNWPDDGIFSAFNGAEGLAQHYSEEDRRALRSGGISTFLEIDGRVWLPSRAGQSIAGTPLWAAQDANELMHSLRQLRALGDADLRAAILRAGGALDGAEPTLQVECTGQTFRVVETATGAVIWQATVVG